MAQVEQEPVFPFGESESDEYTEMVQSICSVLRFANKTDRNQNLELMPHPVKTDLQLRQCAAHDRLCGASMPRLVISFRELEAWEKQASGKYPLLHAFLAQRHLVARHFLMAPVLAALAEPLSLLHKKEKGYKESQSWVFLEYSEGSVREWIPQLLPRSSAARSPAEVARLLDALEGLVVHFLPNRDVGGCTLADVEACGIVNREWVTMDHDPLAFVALELIESAATRAMKSSPPGFDLDFEHPPRLVALKLMEECMNAADTDLDLPYVIVNARQLGLEVDPDCLIRWLYIEDLLEEAKGLQKACDCCVASLKAAVECAGVFSLQLARPRLGQLARELLRIWKDRKMIWKPWIELAVRPPFHFPVPIIQEIEMRFAPRGVKGGRMLDLCADESMEDVVGQFRKARAHGLVKKADEYDEPVLKTCVQLLEMAEAQLKLASVEGEQQQLDEDVVEDEAKAFKASSAATAAQVTKGVTAKTNLKIWATNKYRKAKNKLLFFK